MESLQRRIDKRENQLETVSECNSRWWSIRIICITIFFNSVCRGTLLLSINIIILQNNNFEKGMLSWFENASLCGNIIWSIALGVWSYRRKSIRIPMQISLLISICGMIIFSSMAVFGGYSQLGFISIGFLIGVLLTIDVLCRSYLSTATRLSERTHVFTMAQFADVCGQFVGAIFLMSLHQFDSFHSSGWINLALYILNIFILLPQIFQEHNIAAKEMMVKQGFNSEQETCKSIKPKYLSSGILVAIFCIFKFSEIPYNLTFDKMLFHLNFNENVAMMIVPQNVSFVTIVLMGSLCKCFGERLVLIFGGIFMILMGQLIFITEDLPVYAVILIMYSVRAVGSPICQILLLSMITKQLGPRPQGGWMIILSIVELISSELGFMFANKVVLQNNTCWIVAFSILMISSMIVLIFFKQLFVPPPDTTMGNNSNLEERMQELETLHSSPTYDSQVGVSQKDTT